MIFDQIKTKTAMKPAIIPLCGRIYARHSAPLPWDLHPHDPRIQIPPVHWSRQVWCNSCRIPCHVWLGGSVGRLLWGSTKRNWNGTWARSRWSKKTDTRGRCGGFRYLTSVTHGSILNIFRYRRIRSHLSETGIKVVGHSEIDRFAGADL